MESPSVRPLRIILAPSAYYPHVGGIEELTRQLVGAFESRGHRVSVLTNRWPAGVGRSEILDGVDVTRLRFPLPAGHLEASARFLANSPSAALELVRHVRRRKPDIVHVIGAGPQSVYLGVLAPVLGTSLVFTTQGELTFDAHNAFAHSATLRAGLRRMLRVADAVTACSAYALRDLTKVGRISARSRVIPNGVNPDDFVATASEVEDRPYALAVGRLVPQKGFDVLIEAFRSEELASLDLVIAGEGFERERLARQVRDLGLSTRVRFLGSVGREHVTRLLLGAHVFALPSRGEPFGIALLEAMAAGVPAVATRTGGVVEFARPDVNALLVDPDDPAALAHAIGRLASDTALRARLVRAGRTTSHALAWSRIAPRYEQVYLAALETRSS